MGRSTIQPNLQVRICATQPLWWTRQAIEWMGFHRDVDKLHVFEGIPWIWGRHHLPRNVETWDNLKNPLLFSFWRRCPFVVRRWWVGRTWEKLWQGWVLRKSFKNPSISAGAQLAAGARSKLDGSYIASGTTSDAGVANVELPVGTGGFGRDLMDAAKSWWSYASTPQRFFSCQIGWTMMIRYDMTYYRV